MNIATATATWPRASPRRCRWFLRSRGGSLTSTPNSDTTTWVAAELEAAGIGRAGASIFLSRPSLLKRPAPSVLVDPGMGSLATPDRRCLVGAKGAARPGSSSVGRAKPLRAKLRPSGPRLFWGGVTLRRMRSWPRGGAMATETRGTRCTTIVFTAGAAGPPKAAVSRTGTSPPDRSGRWRARVRTGGWRMCPTFPLFSLSSPGARDDHDHPRDGPDPAGESQSEEDHRAHPAEFGVTTMLARRPLFGHRGRIASSTESGCRHSDRWSRPAPGWAPRRWWQGTSSL